MLFVQNVNTLRIVSPESTVLNDLRVNILDQNIIEVGFETGLYMKVPKTIIHLQRISKKHQYKKGDMKNFFKLPDEIIIPEKKAESPGNIYSSVVFPIEIDANTETGWYYLFYKGTVKTTSPINEINFTQRILVQKIPH